MIRFISFSLLVILFTGRGRSTAPKATDTAAGAATAATNTNSGGNAPAASIDESVLLKGADVIVPAKELRKALGSELAEKYADKTIQTTGTINFMAFDSNTTSIVALSTGPGLLDRLVCKVTEPAIWARLAPGQTITLHGKSVNQGFLSELQWKVVQTGANPCPLFTIEKFVQEFDQNLPAAKERFAKRWFYLTGPLAGLETGEFNNTSATLKSAGPWTVKLALDQDVVALVKALPPGQKLTALCQLESHMLGIDDTAQTIELKALPIVQTFPLPDVQYATDFPDDAIETAELIKQIREAPAEYRSDAAGFIEAVKPEFVGENRGKPLEITGQIRGFYYSETAHQIKLQGRKEFETLDCDMLEKSPWEVYVPGQAVVVKGKLPEIVIIPALKEAVIVKAEPPAKPARELTAADLIKVAKTAGESFDSDWKGQYVRLSGQLINSDPATFGATIDLRGDDDTVIRIQVASGDHAKRMNIDKLKAGDSVKVLAQIDQLQPDTLYLREGWVLSDKPSK